MKEMKSTLAKDHFGDLIDSSRTEPVKITRNNKAVAVVISFDDYTRLVDLEEAWLASKAEAASKEGYIGKTKSADLMKKMLNAKG